MRFFLIIIVFVFTACSDNKTSDKILKPEKMQAVLWDYLSADIYVNEIMREDTSIHLNLESAKLQNKIFSKHNISKEQFYTSFEYYMNNRTILKPLLDTMIVRQQKKDIKPALKTEDSSGLKPGNLRRKKIIDSIKAE